MRKHYTDEQVATALVVLRSNGGNYKRTERQTGVSRATLRAWESGSLKHHDKAAVVQSRTDTQAKLANTFERIANLSTELALEKAPEASYLDLLKGAGISTEKMLLLTGQATNRTETAQIVYIQPSALRDLSIQVLEGELVTPLSHNQTILEGPKTGV